jgi:hypothetical protein
VCQTCDQNQSLDFGLWTLTLDFGLWTLESWISRLRWHPEAPEALSARCAKVETEVLEVWNLESQVGTRLEIRSVSTVSRSQWHLEVDEVPSARCSTVESEVIAEVPPATPTIQAVGVGAVQDCVFVTAGPITKLFTWGRG